MRKLKDLIYDYNDILLALIIIAVAAFVISWRVTSIMDYEGTTVAEAQTEVDFSDVDLNPSGGEDYNTDPDDLELDDNEGSSEGQGETTSTESAVKDNTGSETDGKTTEQTETEKETETEQKLSVTLEDTTITIPSGYYSQSIAKLFVQKGLVSDTKTFLDEVEAQNADTKLKAGTFKIPAGSSVADMVKIISK